MMASHNFAQSTSAFLIRVPFISMSFPRSKTSARSLGISFGMRGGQDPGAGGWPEQTPAVQARGRALDPKRQVGSTSDTLVWKLESSGASGGTSGDRQAPRASDSSPDTLGSSSLLPALD